MITLNKLRGRFDILRNNDRTHSFGARINAITGYHALFKAEVLDSDADLPSTVQTFGTHLDTFMRMATNLKEHPEIRASILSHFVHFGILHLNARAQADRKEENHDTINLINREIDVTWLMNNSLQIAEQRPPVAVQLSALRSFGAVANVTSATLMPEFDRAFYDDRVTIIALNAPDKKATAVAMQYCIR